jgi:DNA-binding NtrC family response regulator
MARILIVDDDKLVRDSLSRLLGQASFEVSTAPDGNTGFEAYRETPADIVFTDLAMPGGGINLIETVLEHFPEAKIVAMSGGHVELLPAALTAGAVDVLKKPFTHQAVFQTLQRVLGSARQA